MATERTQQNGSPPRHTHQYYCVLLCVLDIWVLGSVRVAYVLCRVLGSVRTFPTRQLAVWVANVWEERGHVEAGLRPHHSHHKANGLQHALRGLQTP